MQGQTKIMVGEFEKAEVSTFDGQSLLIDHYDAFAWEDDTADKNDELFSDISFLIERMREFRDFKKYGTDETIPPIIVHCSAGLGRTGTLIAIFNIVESLHYIVDPQNYDDVKCSLLTNKYFQHEFKQIINHPLRISVFGCVRKLREQRMLMVKKFSQYSFIYAYMEVWLLQNQNLFNSVK